MEEQRVELAEQRRVELTDTFRRGLIRLDIVFHVLAALLLLVAGGFILYYALLHVMEPSRESMIHLINDVLLVLIILELLWTIIRFLSRQKFVIGPFLAIGTIAAVRRILLIEVQTSSMEHMPVEKLYELGLSALIILILMIAYYLSVMAQRLEQDS